MKFSRLKRFLDRKDFWGSEIFTIIQSYSVSLESEVRQKLITQSSGKYSFDELHHCGMDKYKKFGSIVCERMLPGVNIVWLYDPIHFEQIFNETPHEYPRRRSHLALAKYRQDRPNVYRTCGLLAT
jgi:hypothetical protein